MAKKTLLDNIIESIKGIDGRLIKQSGTTKQMISDLNYKVVAPAKSAADSAVKTADAAVASAKVTSASVSAIASAIAEAKAGANDALSSIQQAIANASSDAAKIRSDVAKVQDEINTAKTANSASVEALKSDIGSAKKDLADVHDSLDKAQSAIEQNQKLINDSVAKITSDVSATKQDLTNVHDSLTKAQAAAEQNQKAIDKSIAQINDDITQDRKDIASAQQANEDNAKQLDDYSKQAAAQGKTIKSIQDKQDGFTATLADVQGNVAQVSDKVDGLSASLKDTQGNVASVKAQADQLSATLTDHGKAIATLTASTKELSSTLEDADGRLSKVEQTAQTNSSTLSDVQGDLSQVKQDATTLTATLKDAQGNISTLQQKADSVSAQLTSAQGDIATLQTGVDGVKATLTSHDKSIHTLQADSKSLKDSMVNAQGDISTLRKTATDVTSELEDHTGRLSKVEQTASKQETTLSDLQGNLSQVEQKADSNTATISSINKNAMQDRGVITDTNTSFDSLTHLGTYSIKAIGLPKIPEQHYGTLAVSGSAGSGWISQQFVADTTGNIYTRVFSNNAWSAWKQGGSQDAINQVKQTADSNSATIRNVQGDVSTLKQTATGIKSTLASHDGDIHTLQADSKTLKDNMQDTQGNISSLQKTATSLDSEISSQDGRLSKVEQTASTLTNEFSDQQGNLNRVEQTANGTKQTVANQQGQISSIQTDVSGIHETITGQGNQIATINVTLNGLDTKYEGVSGDLNNLSSQITTNSTQIDQNKKAIALKADQDTVSNLTGEVSQNTAQLKVQADQISSKVSSSDFKTLDNKVGGAIAQIDKNSTAIDQTNKDISLKADQTEVDNVKGTASQNSSRIDTMANEIQSKVTSTDVNNIVNSKGYATASTVQSLVTQKADDWNLNLTSLKTDVNAIKTTGGGVNLLTNTDKDISVTSYTTGPYPGWVSINTGFSFEHGKTYTFSAEANNSNNNITEASIRVWDSGTNTEVGIYAFPADGNRHSVTFTIPNDSHNYHLYLYAGHAGIVPGVDVTTTYHHSNLEFGTVAHDWSPAPSDMATVTSVTNLSATVDGIKSTVANKADQSTVTQLSNVIQSKVSSSDFNNLSKTVELQTLDWADINNMRTNGHYFVHNLANNPIGGWVYVDVVGNGNDQIRQDVYQDLGNQHCYRSLAGSWWTDWSEGATKSEINQLSDDINLRVTKGDLISQINLQAGTSLIQSDKLVLDAKTTIFTGDAFIPSAAISSIRADKIMLGSSALYDTNGTLNLVNVKDGITSKIIATQGIVNNDGVLGTASIINFFSDSHTKSFEINPSGVTVTPTLFFKRYNQTPNHWLGFTRHKVRQEGLEFNTWDDEAERFFVNCHARFHRNISANGNIYQGTWDGTAGKPEAGVLSIKDGNTIWSGSGFLAIGDNISGSFTDVQAKTFSQLSILSSKTNIETVDPKDALDLVNQTDIRSYQYKSDVAQGKAKRYTSLIIDDVNDVSKYYTPDEFTNEERTGRDDGSAVGYLFLAVKELTRRIKNLEEKLNG
ncbi:tail fiber domain-containing protein [Fructilactobacillus sanfranciscensis]|uniref:tail fiber domain-containing protein n=1 Tax=Fructilactobacillus sanfranciscensis TaxID=1625 RepID=UPI000CD44758|nr:tail fiber domain-containing protein [Fructilactobacillus sanfranciscensis]POH18765.1 hypothetical protein BGL45_06400 [Fructilactobacillus sanfranciscensis]